MSPEDRQLHRTYSDRLSGFASTEAEKIEARHKLDELEWKGKSGGIHSAVNELKLRVEAVENAKGGGRSGVTKKAFNELEGRLNELVVEFQAVNEAVVNLDQVATRLDEVDQEIRRDQGKDSALIREIQKNVGNMAKKTAADISSITKTLTRIEAAQAKLASGLDDVRQEAIAAAESMVQRLVEDA